jgi:hypothetical protein
MRTFREHYYPTRVNGCFINTNTFQVYFLSYCFICYVLQFI